MWELTNEALPFDDFMREGWRMAVLYSLTVGATCVVLFLARVEEVDLIKAMFVSVFSSLWLLFAFRYGRRRVRILFFRPFREDKLARKLMKLSGEVVTRVTNERMAAVNNPRGEILHRIFSGFFGWYSFIYLRRRRYTSFYAGNDWASRVWVQLAETRLAIFYLPSSTFQVESEIRLAVTCLGLERILFIVSDQEQVKEWTRWLCDLVRAGRIGAQDLSQPMPNVLEWRPDSKSADAEYVRRVEQLLAKIPIELPGLNPRGLELVRGYLPSETTRVARALKVCVLEPVVFIVIYLSAVGFMLE